MNKIKFFTMFNLFLIFNSIFSVYIPPSKIKLLELQNETSWPILLKVYTASNAPHLEEDKNSNQLLKYRLSEKKYSRLHDQNITKIEIEPYGNYLKFAGKTTNVFQSDKDEIDKLCALIIKIIPISKLKWDIKREFINITLEMPKSISSIVQLRKLYLHELIGQSWDKLNFNPAYVKDVLDKINSKDLRYILGIIKDSDYLSLIKAPKEKLMLLSSDLDKNITNSSIFVCFGRAFIKYIFIRFLIENFDFYEKDLNKEDLKALVGEKTTQNIYNISKAYNKIKDKKELLNVMLNNTLNEIAQVVDKKQS